MCWPSQRHQAAYAVLSGMRADKWRHLTYLFDHLVPSVFVSLISFFLIFSYASELRSSVSTIQIYSTRLLKKFACGRGSSLAAWLFKAVAAIYLSAILRQTSKQLPLR